MDTFTENLAYAQEALALHKQVLEDIWRLNAEGIYEITLRTRTRTLVVPVTARVGSQLVQELDAFLLRLYNETQESVEGFTKDAADEAAYARKKRRQQS